MQPIVYFHPQFRNELNRYKISLPQYLNNRSQAPIDKFIVYRDQLYETLLHLELDEIINICTSNKQINQICQENSQIAELIYKKQQQIKQKTDKFLLDLSSTRHKVYPINVAITLEELDIIDELIKRGYDPSADSNLAIELASRRGYLSVVNRLLQDPRVNPSALAIIGALEGGHVEVVKRMLRDKRADPNAKTGRNRTVLVEAAKLGYTDIVEQLLHDPRTDPSINDNEALIEAIYNRDLRLVDMLLADPRLIITNIDDFLQQTIFVSDTDTGNRLISGPRLRKIYEKSIL